MIFSLAQETAAPAAVQTLVVSSGHISTMSLEKVLKGMGYKCVASLGCGTFSKVKLATSRKHLCNVAIKIVDRKVAEENFVKKFLPRELAVLKRVSHEHIIQILEFFEAGSELCIVMEAAASDLLQKIQEVSRVPEEQSKTWFSQMVSAVNYLHQIDIVHRDLKCENILLTADDRVKICDFGFGRFVQDGSMGCRTFCGSAAYTPPEVILNRAYDPKKYDVWSLGVILFVMVTGVMPYDDTVVKRLPRLQRNALVYPDGVHVEEPCRAFIAALLQYEPPDRPSIQQVAEHAWLQAAHGHPA